MTTKFRPALNLPFQRKLQNHVLLFHTWNSKGKVHWLHYCMDTVHLPVLPFTIHVLVTVKWSQFTFPVGIHLLCVSCISCLDIALWDYLLYYLFSILLAAYSVFLYFFILLFFSHFLISMDIFFFFLFLYFPCALCIFYINFRYIFYYFLLESSTQFKTFQMDFLEVLSMYH